MNICDTELTLPQFINKSNISSLTSQFAQIIKLWPNFMNPGHFRFNPVLYKLIYPELSNLSETELCQYYFREGIQYKPLCSQNALKKLLPNTDISNVNILTNINELVNTELMNCDINVLLSKYIKIQHLEITNSKYKCIIVLQIGSKNARELINITKNILQTSANIDILFFVNITDDNVNNYNINNWFEFRDKHGHGKCDYIITTSINAGTDIPTYFMILNYLREHNIISDYILKLHTKTDLTCIKQMTNCFLDGKLLSAISILDSVKTIDILGGKELVMNNYHVHDILYNIYSSNMSREQYHQLKFVAGSAFLSRLQIQLDILNKYQTLIRSALLSCQYISGWVFQSNSPAHALERIIGGFESQANGKTVKVWI